MKQSIRSKPQLLQKIIWAADPLEDQQIQRQSIRVLQDLSKRTGAAVKPVYVLSDGLLRLSVGKTELVRRFKPASENALNHLTKKANLSNISAPTVLVSAPSSRGTAAEALDRYAQSENADLILVNSHGRQGVKRAILGSFAETLMLHAKTPILISGPNTKHIAKIDHILFPTDLSKNSKKTFQRIQELSKKLDAKVTIFHAILNPIEPFAASGAALIGGGYVPTLRYAKSVSDRQKKLAGQWADEAKKNGLEVSVAFDPDSTSVILSILRYAQKNKPGMIAMASESGAVSAALLGSIGRGVAREAPCPVWFLRN